MTIVCHKYRFIFLKTRKTAGSSIEIALSRLCDSDDFITPLGLPSGSDEALRRQEGGHSPVNWKKPWWQYKLGKELRQRIKRGWRAPILGEHASTAQILNHFGQWVWQNYYRITVERDPWDRALSRYWWMRYRSHRDGATDFPTLDDFLKRVARERPHWLSNWGQYTLDNEVAVDRVLEYEDLVNEMQRLEGEIGAPSGSLSLPQKRAKGGYRQDKRHYSEVLTSEQSELIAHLCRNEIREFDYRFRAG